MQDTILDQTKMTNPPFPHRHHIWSQLNPMLNLPSKLLWHKKNIDAFKMYNGNTADKGTVLISFVPIDIVRSMQLRKCKY